MILKQEGTNPSQARVSSRSPDPASARRWLVLAYFGSLSLIAAAFWVTFAPQLQGDLTLLVLFIALNVTSELLPIVVYGDSYISIGFVFTMAIIIMFGPPGVILAAPLMAIAGRVPRHGWDNKVFTNSALFTVVHGLGAVCYKLFAPVAPDNLQWSMVPAVLATAAVCFGANAGLLSLAVFVRTGQSIASFWAKHRWLAPHYLSFGFIGLALATAYVALGIIGVLAFLTPAAMMRLAMKQYVDKTAENVEKLQQQNAALQKANVEVLRMSDELRESYDGTLEALVNALDARDQETKGHSIRVSNYMMDIAAELGIKPGSQQWLDMQRGSLLHDVGKIGVTDSILLKPGKLTDDEWQYMRKHPEIGFNMLRQVKFLEGAAVIIRTHHERWDGKGYPHGLHEEEIPLGARIFNVVDTFDAMTSDRPYRKALTTLDALNEILKYRGTQFDPLVVEAFLDTYEKWAKAREELAAEEEELRRAA
jgi:putative nucleotidyltransferase with HDIG domain